MYWSLLWGSLVQKSFSHQIETHRSTKNFLGGQTKNTWAKILTYYEIYFLKKSIALSEISTENSKILKYHTFSIKN